MSELKTLKDFKRKDYSEGEDNNRNKIRFLDERVLKAEAVRWVKELQEDNEPLNAVGFIKEFFNLTQEDLG